MFIILRTYILQGATLRERLLKVYFLQYVQQQAQASKYMQPRDRGVRQVRAPTAHIQVTFLSDRCHGL